MNDAKKQQELKVTRQKKLWLALHTEAGESGENITTVLAVGATEVTVNRIIKEEYGLDASLIGGSQMRETVEVDAVELTDRQLYINLPLKVHKATPQDWQQIDSDNYKKSLEERLRASGFSDKDLEKLRE